MAKKAYNIYRTHGSHRELIGKLPLATILEIHGENVSSIDDVRNEVTVRESHVSNDEFVIGSDGRKWLI